MATLIGISGSLRKGSYNTMLLNAASAMMPEGDELIRWSINGIPLYDGDLEAMEGIPTAVTELKDAITTADGLLIATPEYNNSMPGVLKNVIDWLSRPPADIDRVFGEKPVAVIGASLGGFGTILSQNAWLPVLRTLGTRPWFGGRLMVSRAHHVFDSGSSSKDF
jgi:chromate reductase, NAD(P)H dehydrogenase (quinone)